MAGMLPVILCGKTTKIAVGVISALKPEMDVVHLCLTPEAGKIEIPAILKQEPVTTDVELGSKNYETIPKAIIVGGGYNDEDLDVLRRSCQTAKTPLVPWLRPDLNKPTPPLGPEVLFKYGKALVERIKLLIKQMEKENKLNGSTDEVFWF
ncbi:Uncharacterized protein BP5553_05814 [Venustampulla echinocandica]|uniref:Uncharacterized protein n=1 Tax=Venustampulla echinocandica TaxID=2656787 RepID=A0A370TLQ4_9HELO|nr:Uncharacterized protein BP5553_05814 [Venustampulla echinocandica]RDL36462.1 Uncharacterized protein BP5553_05814 [Venustampulla echinocandica]